MIRRATLDDTDKICGLWLEASLRAHNFISEDYWRRMLPGIKRDYLPNSETYVFVDKHQIKGFLSLLDGKHIGALFVAPRYQRAKIGTKLKCAAIQHRQEKKKLDKDYASRRETLLSQLNTGEERET